LYKYGVDIAVWGHFHAYERTCAVYKQNCMGLGQGGTVHIVVGTAGYELDDEDWMPKNWSLFHNNNYGFGTISLETDLGQKTTALTWKFFLNNETDSPLDQTTLTKSLANYTSSFFKF